VAGVAPFAIELHDLKPVSSTAVINGVVCSCLEGSDGTCFREGNRVRSTSTIALSGVARYQRNIQVAPAVIRSLQRGTGSLIIAARIGVIPRVGEFMSAPRLRIPE